MGGRGRVDARAAETAEVVCRHISRVRQREAASYLASQLRTPGSHCQRNASKSCALHPGMMKRNVHGTSALKNIPCPNLLKKSK